MTTCTIDTFTINWHKVQYTVNPVHKGHSMEPENVAL